MQKFTHYLMIALAVAGVSCSRSAKSARHLTHADEYFAAGNYDSAEIEYINVLRVDPENASALYRLGAICFEDGRLSRAIACLTKIRDLQATNLDARVKLGQVYLATGKPKEARDEAHFVLAKQPTNEEALHLLVESAVTPQELTETRQQLLQTPVSDKGNAGIQTSLGLLAIQQGDVAAAEAAFKQALAIDPKSIAALGALGTLYWTQNNLKEADLNFKAAADLAPPRSGRQRRYAEFKVLTGDAAAGKAILSDLVKKAPDYLPAWESLAEIALTEKKFDDCSSYIDKILLRDSNFYDGLLLRGRLHVAKGDFAKAATEFENLVATFPQSAGAQYQLALIHLANNDTTKAVTRLNQTLAINPGYTEAIMTLAILDLKGGDLNGAIALLEPVVQRRPAPLKAQELLADAYRAKGDLNAAFKLYQQISEAMPQNAAPPLFMGLILLQQNKHAEARQAFTRALAIAPGYFPAVEQMAGMEYADKEYAAAQQRVEKQIEQNPQQPEAHLLLGKIYLAQRDTKHAEAELLKATELRPDYGAAYMVLANLYLETNQRPLALEKLQTAAAKNPKDAQPLVLSGMIYSQDKNYPAARDAYEKALAINPKLFSALNDLAYLYGVRLGQIDKAYELARRAQELAPNDPGAADTLGWILYLKGQYASALTPLEASAAKLPNEPDVLFHLGMTQYRLGQEAPARQSLTKALDLKKPFEGQEEATQSLSFLAINVKTATADDRAALEKKSAERQNDPIILDRLASLYERDGATDKALDIYQTALRANPNNLRALMGSARIYAGRPADLSKAFDAAKTAYKIAPDDGDVARLLGRLAYLSGDYKWSLSLLQTAALKKSDADLLYDLAEVSYSMGLVAEAESKASEAVAAGASFSRNESAKQFLDMLALAKTPANAVQAADRVQTILQKTPDYVPALMASAVISDQKADAQGAKQTYEKILTRYPDFIPAKKRLAILYLADPKDNPRAFEMAMKAREAYPDDAELTRALGIITYRKGDYSRSAELLSTSSTADKADPQVIYYLGMAQYQLKQAEASKKTLQHALELTLPEDLTAEAKRVLAELK